MEVLRKVVSTNHFRRNINGMNCTERKLLLHTFVEAKGYLFFQNYRAETKYFPETEQLNQKNQKILWHFSSHRQPAPSEAFHFIVIPLKLKLSRSMSWKQRQENNSPLWVQFASFSLPWRGAGECLMIPTCGTMALGEIICFYLRGRLSIMTRQCKDCTTNFNPLMLTEENCCCLN